MVCPRVPLQLPAALSATLLYLATGALICWPTPMIPRLTSNSSHIPLTADQGSWLASVGPAAMFPTALLSGVLVDVVGRRSLLLACAPPFLVYALWQRFASSFWELMVSIIIANATVGFVTPVTPMYMVEIAEDRVRGLLITLGPLMAGIGSFMMIVVATNVSYFGVTEFMMVWPILFMVTFWWMPESPYYLVAKGHKQEATKALMRLRGKSFEKDVEQELKTIKEALEARTQQQISIADAFRELKRNPGARRAITLSLCFTALVVMSGCMTIGLYTVQIFSWSDTGLDANMSAVVVCAVQVAFALVASLLVDRLGRRPLLLASFGGCAVCLAALGAYFYLMAHGSQEVVDSLYWLPLTALLLFYVCYDIGGNALLWVLSNEMVPLSVRGLCNSCITVLSGILTFGLSKLFQVVESAFGYFVPIWFFTFCCAVGFFFTWIFIPETKGRSLEEISAEMTAKAGGSRNTCL